MKDTLLAGMLCGRGIFLAAYSRLMTVNDAEARLERDDRQGCGPALRGVPAGVAMADGEITDAKAAAVGPGLRRVGKWQGEEFGCGGLDGGARRRVAAKVRRALPLGIQHLPPGIHDQHALVELVRLILRCPAGQVSGRWAGS